MKLSVVVITLNEEHNIRRCLASVRSIADDIVVVDSGSTDRTCGLAIENGARVIYHKFEGHIEQKNYAKEQAMYEWVLSLDADEALDEKLQENILLWKTTTPLSEGYKMDRLTNFCGKWIRHGGWYPDSKLRLWNRHKGEWTGMNPHDKFELYAAVEPGKLGGNILHYSYYTTEQHLQQTIYFADIAAKAAHKHGLKSRWWRILFSPLAKFLKMYVLKAGWMDGYFGWLIAQRAAYGTWLKYTKLRELGRSKTD